VTPFPHHLAVVPPSPSYQDEPHEPAPAITLGRYITQLTHLLNGVSALRDMVGDLGVMPELDGQLDVVEGALDDVRHGVIQRQVATQAGVA
jgi:hypothetical protein